MTSQLNLQEPPNLHKSPPQIDNISAKIGAEITNQGSPFHAEGGEKKHFQPFVSTSYRLTLLI